MDSDKKCKNSEKWNSRHGQASLTAKDSLGATALMIAVQHKQLGGRCMHDATPRMTKCLDAPK